MAGLQPEIDLWDRQPSESAKQFHAFCHYRDMPAATRSVVKAYRDHLETCRHKVITGNPVAIRVANQWHLWSSSWGWVQRAAAWDREQGRMAQAKILKEQVDCRVRQARHAQTHQQVAIIGSRIVMEALQDPAVLARAVQAARDSGSTFLRSIDSALNGARAFPGLVAVERLALGMNTESIAIEDKRRESSIGDRIAADPQALEMAIMLVDRVAGTTNGNGNGNGHSGT